VAEFNHHEDESKQWTVLSMRPDNGTGCEGIDVMEKNQVVNLDDDEIFRHSVPYDESRMVRETTDSIIRRSEDVKDHLCDLVLRGAIDRMDLQIVHARDASPFPSMAAVAAQLGIDKATVSRRMQRIKALMING
jgi:hypothetical protein